MRYSTDVKGRDLPHFFRQLDQQCLAFGDGLGRPVVKRRQLFVDSADGAVVANGGQAGDAAR